MFGGTFFGALFPLPINAASVAAEAEREGPLVLSFLPTLFLTFDF